MRRTPLSREWADRGMAPSWLAINGNKRSLTLDLQKPAAIEIVQTPGRARRRGDGEFPRRRDGSSRHRLHRAVRDQSASDLLCNFRLRPDRSLSQRGRIRRQDPGAVRHHVDDRPRGQRPDARGLRGVRRVVRHDRRIRGFIRPVPAHADRPGAVHRRVDAGGEPRVPVNADRRFHCRRPSAGAIRQPGDQPQGHGQSVPGQSTATCCWRSTTTGNTRR